MPPPPTRAAGLARLATFLPLAGTHYARWRNHEDGPPAPLAQDQAEDGLASAGWGRGNVSQLSPYLHAGLLSAREVTSAVLERHGPEAAGVFISEMVWQIYFKGYLEQRPSIWRAFARGREAALARAAGDSALAGGLDQARAGATGIAAFDLWAHELVATGYLHNHARMWFASIWIFTLRLPWELGADFFLRHLADGDAAANTLSWRWVGGLHTMGKTYLARADNIARYTGRHPHGPLCADGLADEAPALIESELHPTCPLALPPEAKASDFAGKYALLLHDEAASHIPLGPLPHAPALVIGASRVGARSPLATGAHARGFVEGALARGMAEASAAFTCPQVLWPEHERGHERGHPSLASLLVGHGIDQVVMAHLPTGWTRDALAGALEPLAREGRIVALLDPLSRAVWPLSGAGFFKVKARIPQILARLGPGLAG